MNNFHPARRPLTGPGRRFSSTAAALLAAAAMAAPCLADPAREDRISVQSVTVDHVRITSKRPFDTVKAALESKVRTVDRARMAQSIQKGDLAGARAELEKTAAPTGLSILYSLNHGAVLALEGAGARKAIAYGIGNVLIANSMTRHKLAAGLYAPLRVLLYEAADGTAVFEYDLPSSQFRLFGDAGIDSVAARLDTALESVLKDASR